MNYFKEYEKLKESKQLIPIGSIWISDYGQIKVNGFDDTFVNFKEIPDEGMCIFSGQYDWRIERFIRTFTRVT